MVSCRGRRGRLAVSTVFSLVILFLVVLLPGCSWFSSTKKNEKESVKKPEPITCPLCGLEVTGREFIDRRPLAVKVENDPAARPQSGLKNACIVYEEITEGGITRFMAMFLCRDVDVIGPVRSARPADIDLAFPYQALFCHCGGASPTLREIKASGMADLDELTNPGAYWRSKDRRAPHNLYTGTARLRSLGDPLYPYSGEVGNAFEFLDAEEVEELERKRVEEVERLEEYRKKPVGEFKPKLSLINTISIPYTGSCAVSYGYDPAGRKYLRYIRGVPHTDMTTGEQLAADTVIVQYVTESMSGIKDVRGNDTPDLGVVGFGRAQVITVGQLVDANWEKNARDEHTRYFDNDGKEIKVKPGQTWVQLVPINMQVAYQ